MNERERKRIEELEALTGKLHIHVSDIDVLVSIQARWDYPVQDQKEEDKRKLFNKALQALADLIAPGIRMSVIHNLKGAGKLTI